MVENPITGKPCVRGKEEGLVTPGIPIPSITYDTDKDLLLVVFKTVPTKPENVSFALVPLFNAESEERECVSFRIKKIGFWCKNRGLSGRLTVSRILQEIAKYEGTPRIHTVVHDDILPLLSRYGFAEIVLDFPTEN